jgi:hypothetical protein
MNLKSYTLLFLSLLPLSSIAAEESFQLISLRCKSASNHTILSTLRLQKNMITTGSVLIADASGSTSYESITFRIGHKGAEGFMTAALKEDRMLLRATKAYDLGNGAVINELVLTAVNPLEENGKFKSSFAATANKRSLRVGGDTLGSMIFDEDFKAFDTDEEILLKDLPVNCERI